MCSPLIKLHNRPGIFVSATKLEHDFEMLYKGAKTVLTLR